MTEVKWKKKKKSKTWTFRLTIFVSSSENLELKEKERSVYYVGQLEGFGVAVKPHSPPSHLRFFVEPTPFKTQPLAP